MSQGYEAKDPSSRDVLQSSAESIARSPPQQEANGNASPFRVLGIALVVDQLGKGARVVLRYPTAPLGKSSHDDLFYRLPTTQLAKLFRPKPALCRQPMTLSVGGTVFCCYAVPMKEDDHAQEEVQQQQQEVEEENNNNNNKYELSLFSVIVALAPRVRTTSIPISGWLENQQEPDPDPTHLEINESWSEGNVAGSGSSTAGRSSRASASFLSIRRVHVSLARLCRILEREERRCKYVSMQADLVFSVRNEIQKAWRAARQQLLAESAKAVNATSNASVTTSASKVTVADRTIARHPRAGSFSMSFDTHETNHTSPPPEHASNHPSGDDDSATQVAIEQEVLETVMAAGDTQKPSTSDSFITGNLAREVVQVYHSLARNELELPSTATAILTGRDDLVYINGHIALVVEPVSLNCHRDILMQSSPIVRAYQTLFFPHVSPSQLLESLSFARSRIPRQLQQLLMTVNPQQNLAEIAVTASLPLQTTTDLAKYLISQGLCVAAMPLTRNSRLACHDVRAIHSHSLEFTQHFGGTTHLATLFALVSYLTSDSRTLGEAMVELTLRDGEQISWIRNSLWSVLGPQPAREDDLDDSFTEDAFASAANIAIPGMISGGRSGTTVASLEELVYQIALWLYSHNVVDQLQDYLVLSTSAPSQGRSFTIVEGPQSATDINGERKDDCALRLDAATDAAIFRELQASGCLNGTIPLPACCWQTGLDYHKLSAFCARHSDQIRVITRLPETGEN